VSFSIIYADVREKFGDFVIQAESGSELAGIINLIGIESPDLKPPLLPG
jgi:hypothetical protein